MLCELLLQGHGFFLTAQHSGQGPEIPVTLQPMARRKAYVVWDLIWFFTKFMKISDSNLCPCSKLMPATTRGQAALPGLHVHSACEGFFPVPPET